MTTPTPAPEPSPAPAQVGAGSLLMLAPPPPDLREPYGPGADQFGHLYLPTGSGPGPHPVVVLVHGGFWRSSITLDHAGHLGAALATRGVATWTLEFRRVGQPGGGWPGTLQDVLAGTSHVRVLATRYPLDLDRVVLVGHSAGGHLALLAAAGGLLPPLFGEAADAGDRAVHRLRGVVSLAGVVDLRQAADLHLGNDAVRDFLGDFPDEVPERYQAASPRERLPLGVPQLLVHGTADDRVPFGMGQDYAEAARAAGDRVTFVRLDDVDHMAVIDPRTSAGQDVVDRTVGLLA